MQWAGSAWPGRQQELSRQCDRHLQEKFKGDSLAVRMRGDKRGCIKATGANVCVGLYQLLSQTPMGLMFLMFIILLSSLFILVRDKLVILCVFQDFN